MAGAVDRARVEASDVVEDLFNAGVRFAHLSRDNERRTKAFGHELGLETDWNSCIDLNEQSAAFSTQSSPMLGGGGVTKLPRGIGAVRPHLRDVDNVPLLVSMFCNCQPRTVREMIQIYQENCELVCVVGSCGAPLSASSELGAAEMLDSACCVAVLPDGHDLEQLTEWLLQGRSFLSNTRQAVFFGGFASIVLELLLIVADWTRLPPPQTPFQLLWVLLVLVPLLAFPLVLGPVDPRNKKEMVSKNEDHLANAPSAALYLVLRALPGAAGLCLLFADQSAVPVAEAARLPGSLVERAGAEPREALALAHAQLLTQWWATLLLAAHSASFAHRTLNDSQYSPFANRLWVRAAALAFGLESVAVFVQLGPARIPAILGQIPWYGHLVGVGMMLLAGIVDWIVKRHDRRAFERTNKGMYLEFTTKLGMHSPIEPGHLAPTSYLDE
ncbi:hypothetical protein EMIHUDRAFT_455937 [Emiliania huxleyi CCMP1516]|uniref:Cation-transporting P-type ATPase C-terminal domain-containing protein n=2 Tax=Emiliania huxleyi TaxID=2903 RepID=A0A0D3KAU6_EMIH1|nr:hypothetical protein EMIHUDRAFT_455937 [Emiliania huxleyi CCMP1516]EOD32881.1 hypothetical protein EMIHUDRAFT_455937 [Emiliania huxleyi CCMP1516]|eukprot:XP_005785310.1 hypothetical protein EMIHUDRAFT_455937 [Emiliania huxleyi CCMP1516]